MKENDEIMEVIMISTGLVVEYNPFHNGHAYHVEQARKMTDADVIVAVMSGNFLQRGEPAIVSKWARTRMALEAGIDIVIELPYAFAVQQAQVFSYGAIAILNELKCDNYCFGSESGNITEFLNTLNVLEEKREQYELQINQLVKTGISYPSALAKSFSSLELGEGFVDLSKPNNILGYHYVLAAHQLQSAMKAFTVGRKNANYHDVDFSSSTIASATSIRKALALDESIKKIEQYVPNTSTKELQHYKQAFGLLHQWEQYWSFLQYRLLTMDIDELASIYEVEEGLEYRLKRMAKESTSFEAFMNKVKTKRYTWTRIQRICVHVLTNTKKATMLQHQNEIEYIRLLGMSSNGRHYINLVKKEVTLPLISKLSAVQESLVELDTRAAAVYSQVLAEPYRGKLYKMEYAQPPIFLERKNAWH